MTRLVLASASPRRAELLTAAGFEFDVIVANVDETRWPDEAPAEHVVRLAIEKATVVADKVTRQIAQSPDRRVVLGADTIVVADEGVLGKPRDRDEAVRMLRLLSGRAHDVLTGVAIVRGDDLLSECVCTEVAFSELTAEEIDWYVDTGEPMDKAGAYAVQGLASRFVSRIDGSYSNVVGLPIETVYRLLAQLR